MKSLSIAMLGAVLLGAAIFGFSELGFRLTQRYAPAYEGVRRETFEQSRAFQEGTVRDLENLYLDWSHGSDAQKAAIASVARRRLADVDPAILTPELRAWRGEIYASGQ